MKVLRVIRYMKESFVFRIFAYFTGAMVLLTIAFNGFFLHFQWQMLSDGMHQNGSALARILAHNVRLGVFSENVAQLSAPVEAVMTHQGVLEAMVVNRDGKCLKRTSRSDRKDLQMECQSEKNGDFPVLVEAARTRDVVHLDRDKWLEFWAPVFSTTATESEDRELLYFSTGEGSPVLDASIIGFVGVSMDRELLRKGIKDILARNAIIAGVLLILGCVVTSLIVAAVTRPLSRLMSDVRQQGIDMRSMDEVGMLSDTFTGLVARLSESFSTINALKSGLEETVKERTTDLAKANMELEERRHFLELANKELGDTLARLQETQVQLIQSEKMAALGQLVAGVAHEINNTVNFISGAVPPLKRMVKEVKGLSVLYDELSPQSRKVDLAKKFAEVERFKKEIEYEELFEGFDTLLDNIKEGVRRTTRIVQDLKSFARPEQEDMRPFDLHVCLDTTLNLLHHELKHSVELIKEYGADVPMVRCSPGQINQVLVNIFINSVQAFGRKKGTIWIRTWCADGLVHVSIKDNGPGIPKAIQGRIFDPFFTTKPVGKGTGLGLSISYGIIKKHQGEIKVASEEGVGAEFDVVLPAMQEERGDRVDTD